MQPASLLAVPVVLPFLTAIACVLLRAHPVWQRAVGVLGAGGLFAASLALFHYVSTDGILVMQMGDWPAPFGITFVADLLASIMVILGGMIGLAGAVYSLFTVDRESERLGYYPMLHVLLGGVSGAFLTGDLFNLYVWFEVLLIASFVLLVLGGTPQQMEGAIKYVMINLVSSITFLTAVGILYGIVGTLNMADLSVKLSGGGHDGLVLAVGILFMVAFGVKAAVFPLFFWLPASYHTPHFAVSAVFAGLLTKVGVYALYRVFSLIFVQDIAFTHTTILLVVAGLTMVTGVLGAVAQEEFRRVLSFHIVSQIGYMVLGLALFTPLAIAGGVFYIAHHIIVKANLFFVAGVAHRILGTGQLSGMGGLWRAYPFIGILFLIPAMSLAGMPPMSGFWAKVFLIKASLDATSYVIAAVALAVGLFTLFSMMKLWLAAFWKRAPHRFVQEDDPISRPDPTVPEHEYARPLLTMVIPIALLALVTLTIGLAAAPLLDVSMRAAEQLLDPSAYIEAVLGVTP
jgi:multicomponent Na+:H+ antiporter subunit D